MMMSVGCASQSRLLSSFLQEVIHMGMHAIFLYVFYSYCNLNCHCNAELKFNVVQFIAHTATDILEYVIILM